MKIDKFEDIIAWQKAKDLFLLINNKLKYCRNFSFKDQIFRSSMSVMNNIAEGFERKGDKQFKNFLFIAKGSSGETRSMLYLAFSLSYISQDEYVTMYNLTLEISRILSGLIKSLDS